MGCAQSIHTAAQPAPLCAHICECGHICGGVSDEAEHLGCVQEGCAHAVAAADDVCPVCLEAPAEQPSIRLGCGHIIHHACAQALLGAVDWKGGEIKPAEVRCPAGCGANLQHALLSGRLAPLLTAVAQAGEAAAKQAAADGVAPAEAEAKYRVYQCHTCTSPFVGGLRSCASDAAGSGGKAKLRALCEGCRAKSTKICKKHGATATAYKCNYCCGMATFTCGGGIERFCTTCHIGAAHAFHQGHWSRWQAAAIKAIPPCDRTSCPFGGAHPKGRTHAWHAPCSECFMLRAAATVRADADGQPAPTGTAGAAAGAANHQAKKSARPPRGGDPNKRCETPGCTRAVAAVPAPWNANGRHCCGGCMRHGADATMRPNPAAPPERCHDGRCGQGPTWGDVCGACDMQ